MLINSVKKWIPRMDLIGISYVLSASATCSENDNFVFDLSPIGNPHEHLLINGNEIFLKLEKNNQVRKLVIERPTYSTIFSRSKADPDVNVHEIIDRVRSLLLSAKFDVTYLFEIFNRFGLNLNILEEIPGSIAVVFKNLVQSRISYACDSGNVVDIAMMLRTLASHRASPLYLSETSRIKIFELLSIENDLIKDNDVDCIIKSLCSLGIGIPDSMTDDRLVPLFKRILGGVSSVFTADTVVAVSTLISDLGAQTQRDLVPLVLTACQNFIHGI
jgi:hypothetical protein